MACCRTTYHLSVVDYSNIRGTHCIKMSIFFIRDKDNFSVPFIVFDKVTDVLFPFTSIVQTYHCHKVFKRLRFSWKRSWSRIFKQELLYSFSHIFTGKFSFIFFVSWSKEDDMSIICNLILFSPLLSNCFNTFLQVWLEESFACVQRVSILT